MRRKGRSCRRHPAAGVVAGKAGYINFFCILIPEIEIIRKAVIISCVRSASIVSYDDSLAGTGLVRHNRIYESNVFRFCFVLIRVFQAVKNLSQGNHRSDCQNDFGCQLGIR